MRSNEPVVDTRSMESRFDRLEDKLDSIADELHKISLVHEARLTKLETTQKGFVAVSAALMMSVVAYFFNLVVK